MKDLKQIRLEYKIEVLSLNNDINVYKATPTDNGTELNTLLKTITTRLYYLSTIRVVFHDKWNNKVKDLVENTSSVSRAENFAHVDYPELYELRRVMEAGYAVVGAIRSNLSYLKKEMETINNQ